MICQRCVLRLKLSRPRRPTFTSVRHYSSLNASTAPSPGDPPSGDHEGPPAAASTSAAQPFSTPLTPRSDALNLASSPTVKRSSVPAGVVLKSLGYFKSKDPPLTLEDHEYPDWLWTLLDKDNAGEASASSDGDGDMYSKSRKERRKAAKKAAKMEKEHPESLIPKVPLEHQSIDLPAGDGSIEGSIEAEGARQELRAAMRQRRRGDIKESNFLKGMR